MGHALIRAILRDKPDRMAMLQAVAACVPYGWLAAGAIRNAVWDHLHGYNTPLSDADVADDTRLETVLSARMPDVPWSVRNQARMHIRNGHALYRDCADAMRRWPETATAIAARLRGDAIALLAPLGVDDLLKMTVRRAMDADATVCAERLRSKAWQAHWPRPRVMP